VTHERNDEPAQDENAKRLADEFMSAEETDHHGGHIPFRQIKREFNDCGPVVVDELVHSHKPGYPTFDFGMALALLKDGARVQRAGWNGKGMFVFLVPGSTFTVNRPPLLGIYPEGTVINYHPHIDMKTADGMIVPWLASQTDILAADWQLV
jgi:hypothetical protein